MNARKLGLNGPHFDEIFKCISLKETVCGLILIALKFVVMFYDCIIWVL